MCQQWDTLYTNINDAEYWITQAGYLVPKYLSYLFPPCFLILKQTFGHLNFVLTVTYCTCFCPWQISNLEEKMNLATMTRVQQMSIPVILREKDVLIKSQTGSGEIVPDIV